MGYEDQRKKVTCMAGNGLGEKVIFSCRRLKDTLLPWGTKRWAFYQWLIKRVKKILGVPPKWNLGETILLRYRGLKTNALPWGTKRRAIYQWCIEKIQRKKPERSTIPTKNHLFAISLQSNPDKYDIICFPIIDWHFRYQRPQQILHQIAQAGHRVFYIDVNFVWSDKEGYFEITPIEENIFLCTLNSKKAFNIYQDKIDSCSLEVLKKSIDSLIVTENVKDALCVIDLSFWVPLAFYLKSSHGVSIVYDCMDDHSGFITNSSKMISQEESLRKESDLILASSRRLYNSCKIVNENTVLITNATDVNHFASAQRDKNNPLVSLKPPIIGYYGAISDWFDVDLVKSVAKKCPDYSFVLIGRVAEANLSGLQSLPNVYHFDEVPYKILPNYLAWFDVGIIPFKISPLTLATNPVKFYEFLSAGKPVVSVRLPELEQYQHLCYLASNKDEFVQALSKAIKENTSSRIEERVHFAKSHTWEERVKVITKAIKDSYRKVSIIIVTYNNIHLTQQCLESIKKYTAYPNYEIIVVDNASTDGTVNYLESLETKGEIRFIRNTENKGFSAANNQGIKASSGEYLVLLNNDTVVTRGWLTRMVYYLNNSLIGLVGPVSNWVGNEAKIDTDYKSLEEMQQFAERYTLDNRGKSFEINMLAMFCLGMRRQLIDEIGLLDENFGIGSFEDDDFSYRVKQKGYRIVCAEDIFIHHEGMASLKKLTNQNYRQIFEKNKKYFENKWSVKWISHKYRE